MSAWVTIAILGIILHLAIIALNCAFGLYTLFAEPRAAPANRKERVLVALFGLQGTLMLKLDEWANRSIRRMLVMTVVFFGVLIGLLAVALATTARYGSEAGLTTTVICMTLLVSALGGILMVGWQKRLVRER